MVNKKSQPNTLEITNFDGRLTRIKNGKINSGFAKFNTSFGYDPFSKPGQLTWFEAPVDLDPNDTSIALTMVCGKIRIESNQLYVYAIGTNYSNAAKLFKIQPNSLGNPNLDSSSVIATLTNNSFLFGGSMEFFGGNTSVLTVTNDTKLLTINTTGSGESSKSTFFSANTYHPLTKYLGKIFAGDGVNLTSMDASLTVTSSVLSPGLPVDTNIRDVGVTPEGNYLSMAASAIPPERQDAPYDVVSAAGGSGYVFNWNGSDGGVTNYKSFPSHAITSFRTYMNNQYLFSNDSFGASLSDGNQKLLTLTNNRSVIPNAVATNGNFITWTSTEFVDSTLKGSMYYFGSLDKEVPAGLWRMFRQVSSQTNGFIYTVPFNMTIENKFSTLNNAQTSVISYGFGKHYFSTYDIANGGSPIKYKLYRFCVTSTGTGTPQAGVWETQNQLFSKRVSLSEIRVYTEPTVTGNGFQLDLIGNDGNVISNGTFTYSFAAGTDITLLQGALERINFNTDIKPVYSLGIRITNTGSTNMTINKIEIDWVESGK